MSLHQNRLEGLHRVLGPHAQVSDPVVLGICISKIFPGASDTAGPGHIVRTTALDLTLKVSTFILVSRFFVLCE